jgi:hypothetical protein
MDGISIGLFSEATRALPGFRCPHPASRNIPAVQNRTRRTPRVIFHGNYGTLRYFFEACCHAVGELSRFPFHGNRTNAFGFGIGKAKRRPNPLISR